MKGLKRGQPYSSAMNHSQPQFKMEVKVDKKPSKGEINYLKLNH